MTEKPTKKSYETIKRDLSILIIDDDDSIVRAIKRILQASNPKYYIESVSTVSRAIEMAKKTYWDTILIDLSLPWDEGGRCDPANGMRAVEMLRGEMKITAPIIAITGHDDREDLSDTVLDLGPITFSQSRCGPNPYRHREKRHYIPDVGLRRPYRASEQVHLHRTPQIRIREGQAQEPEPGYHNGQLR